MPSAGAALRLPRRSEGAASAQQQRSAVGRPAPSREVGHRLADVGGGHGAGHWIIMHLEVLGAEHLADSGKKARGERRGTGRLAAAPTQGPHRLDTRTPAAAARPASGAARLERAVDGHRRGRQGRLATGLVVCGRREGRGEVWPNPAAVSLASCAQLPRAPATPRCPGAGAHPRAPWCDARPQCHSWWKNRPPLLCTASTMGRHPSSDSGRLRVGVLG